MHRYDYGNSTCAAPPFISGAASVCAGSTTTLTDLPGGTWSSSDTTVAFIGLTTGIVTGAAVTTPGSATITYTSPTGCTTTQIITVYPLPPAITGTMHVCVGQTTILGDPSFWWHMDEFHNRYSNCHALRAASSSVGIVGGVTPGTDTITLYANLYRRHQLRYAYYW